MVSGEVSGELLEAFSRDSESSWRAFWKLELESGTGTRHWKLELDQRRMANWELELGRTQAFEAGIGTGKLRLGTATGIWNWDSSELEPWNWKLKFDTCVLFLQF